MSLSNSIKIIRQKALLNQTEFADILGVGLTTVNRWEVEKSIPNISAMKKIKRYCNERGIPYENIENEWIASRMQSKEKSTIHPMKDHGDKK